MPFPLKPGIAQSEGGFPRDVQGWAPGFCAANGDLHVYPFWGMVINSHWDLHMLYIYVCVCDTIYIYIYKYFILAITQHEESMIVGWPFPYAMFWLFDHGKCEKGKDM